MTWPFCPYLLSSADFLASHDIFDGDFFTMSDEILRHV